MVSKYIKDFVLNQINLINNKKYLDIANFQRFIIYIGGIKILEDIFKELNSKYGDNFRDLKLDTTLYIFEQAVQHKNYELANSSFNTIFKTLKKFIE